MRPQVHIQSHGAQIKYVDPWPIFYLSPIELPQELLVRGGQHILFPQFSQSGPLKKHGFVRDLKWRICEDTQINNLHRVVCSTEISEGDFLQWPYGACLILSIELRLGIMSQKLEIKNTGNKTFSWTGGLHPYFYISNFADARLDGLDSVNYFDRYAPNVQHVQCGPLGWNERACEKLFNRSLTLKLWTGSNHLTLQAKGFDQWMVWNPGLEGAKNIVDIPHEDWKKFICIEPVCVSRPVYLRPGEFFEGVFEINFDPKNFEVDAFYKTDLPSSK
jgi:glucose-6-phosphate 1-epimerase